MTEQAEPGQPPGLRQTASRKDWKQKACSKSAERCQSDTKKEVSSGLRKGWVQFVEPMNYEEGLEERTHS